MHLSRLLTLVLGISLCAASVAIAQQSQSTEEKTQETEIIVIERSTDRQGNETVTKTVTKGDFTDEEIEKIVQQEMESEGHGDMHKHDGDHESKGFLGVHIEDTEDQGVAITQIVEGSPAETAGLQVGDVIKGVGGAEVSDMENLVELVSDFAPGESVEITYAREGAPGQVDVTLASRNMVKHKEHMERMEKIEWAEKEHKKHEKKRKLGVYLGDSDDNGVHLSDVSEGGIAKSAGLAAGDVITSFNGKQVSSSQELIDAIQGAPAGESVTVEYTRNGEKHTKTVEFDF